MPLLLELRRTSDGGGQQPSEPPLAVPPDLCLREQDDGVVMGRGLHSLPNSLVVPWFSLTKHTSQIDMRS